MQTAPIPHNEEQRLDRLRGLCILDTLPQKAFDDLTALAQVICGMPVALISFIDRDRQWFKSRVGTEVTDIPRELAFCSHAILEPDKVMVVEDLRLDPRFLDNPLVTGPTSVRFYAGAPIITHDGFALGTVCVGDQMPRTLHSVQICALGRLASLVATLVEHQRMQRLEAVRNARAAHEEHEELIAMAASGLDLHAYIDADGVYRHVNQTFLNYVGATRDEVIGATMKERLGEVTYSLVGARMERVLAGETVIYQRISQFKAAGRRHMEITLLPVRDPNGLVTGVVMRGRDIQELKNKEIQLGETIARLEKKTLEQERFIHILSHDLREPVNAINNFASLLQDDHAHALPTEAQRYLGFVRAGGQRLARSLDDLLRYVRLDRHRLARAPVDMAELARQLRDDLGATLEQSQGSLEWEALATTVQADAPLLHLVLKHLVSNGLAFARPGVAPVVRVRATRENGFDLIHVEDNGLGIADEHQACVFDMFKRLHPRKTHPGTGLGLSTCRRIAALHGGHVSMTSTPGVGSRFTLHLPLPHGTPS